MRIKHVGYYWLTPNEYDGGKLTGKTFRNWLYYQWVAGNWVLISHEKWCRIAQALKKNKKGERWETEEIRLKGQPSSKQLRDLGL